MSEVNVVDCDGCSRSFHLEDLQELKWEYPEGVVDYHSDHLCEECVRKMCESVGLYYEEPEEMPEPVTERGSA